MKKFGVLRILRKKAKKVSNFIQILRIRQKKTQIKGLKYSYNHRQKKVTKVEFVEFRRPNTKRSAL